MKHCLNLVIFGLVLSSIFSLGCNDDPPPPMDECILTYISSKEGIVGDCLDNTSDTVYEKWNSALDSYWCISNDDHERLLNWLKSMGYIKDDT